jgi:hypothetical protein
MDRTPMDAKEAIERAMCKAVERQRLERNRDSAAGATQDLPKGRRQELRDRYGLSLPDTVPVAPDPTRRPAALPLDEAGTSLTRRTDLHERLAAAVTHQPRVELPDGLHQRLARALGR